MCSLFGGIKPFISDANQEVALVAILGKSGYSMIHADGYCEFEGTKNFREDHANTATEAGGLRRIGLRKEEGKFIAADAEGRVGSSQSFF